LDAALGEHLSELISEEDSRQQFAQLCLQQIITARLTQGVFMPNFTDEMMHSESTAGDEVQDL